MDAIKSTLFLLTEPWALLILGASFAFAVMNYIDEWLLNRLGTDDLTGKRTGAVGTLVIISGSFGLVVAAAFGAVSLVDPAYTIFIGRQLEIQAVAVGALEIAWLVPYFYATSRSGALEAAPLFQSVPVVALLLGLGIFAEVPPWIYILGAGAIIGGGTLINVAPGARTPDARTLLLMLAASTMIALSHFLFKEVAIQSNFIATAFWGGVGMTLAATGVFVFWPPYRRQFLSYVKKIDGKGATVQFGNEAIDSFAVLASQFAVVLGPSVMTVSALNAYQPIFILLIGVALARAGSTKHRTSLAGGAFYRKLSGIVAIAAGTVLIAL